MVRMGSFDSTPPPPRHSEATCHVSEASGTFILLFILLLADIIIDKQLKVLFDAVFDETI